MKKGSEPILLGSIITQHVGSGKNVAERVCGSGGKGTV